LVDQALAGFGQHVIAHDAFHGYNSLWESAEKQYNNLRAEFFQDQAQLKQDCSTLERNRLNISQVANEKIASLTRHIAELSLQKADGEKAKAVCEQASRCLEQLNAQAEIKIQQSESLITRLAEERAEIHRSLQRKTALIEERVRDLQKK